MGFDRFGTARSGSERGTPTARRGTAVVVTLVLGFAATVVAASPAVAAVTCSHDDVSTATLTVGANEFPTVFVDGSGNILVDPEDDGTGASCDGATTANTTSLLISGVTGDASYEGVFIDQAPAIFPLTTTVADMDEFDVRGTAANDTIRAGETASNVVIDLDNDDTVDVTLERPELRHLNIDGSDGNDTIDVGGSSGGFTVGPITALGDGTFLRGNDGDDTIVGSDGRDTIIAEEGENTIEARDGNDDIDVGGAESNDVDGGGGTDRLRKDFIPFSDVVLSNTLLTVTTPGGPVTDDLQSVEQASISFANPPRANVDASDFSGRADVFGTDGNDTIVGPQGGGSYLAGEGDDLLVAGPGNDELKGEGGTDTVSYETAVSGVTIVLGQVSPQPTGSSGSDSWPGVENAIGSPASDTLNGDGSPNVITGGGGGDTIIAGEDNDTLVGTVDADTLDGGGGADTVSYSNAPAGVTVDLRLTGAQDTTGAGTDTIIAAERAIGSAFRDTLIGSAERNVLVGGAGGDKIKGLAQGDKLIGGRGRDTLNGGAGNDTCKSGEVLISC